MSDVPSEVLEAVIELSADAVLVVQVDQTEWPVRYANDAFSRLAVGIELEKPFADVCEALFGRDTALNVSAAVRSQEAARLPVTTSGRECILSILPLADGRFAAAFLRDVSGGTMSAEESAMAEALLSAKRTIRDLDRDDPVTGLLNAKAFRDVLAHDFAVAAREKSTLALVHFALVDFDAYQAVFGQHASDSCLRRVGHAIRRCLRRASDVVARIDDGAFIVLSHASGEEAVHRFAAEIAASVRDLGIHHPRSRDDRFVTVEFSVVSTDSPAVATSAESMLASLVEPRASSQAG